MARTYFTLTIDTNNAAFHVESNDEDNGTYTPEGEVDRLLREVADKVKVGYTHGAIIDFNGNTVGSFEFTREG